MIRIINNTNTNHKTLLHLYRKEIASVKNKGIECIVFNRNSFDVFGIDCLLLTFFYAEVKNVSGF